MKLILEGSRAFQKLLCVVLLFAWTVLICQGAEEAPIRPPNIIFILADDLGYGDLGSYGQTKIKTPNLDQMAREGMRFTSAYAGSTVCAPSRCALVTGKHMGNARIRGNRKVPLELSDVTVAEVLKGKGYQTALIGKWGLGDAHTTGSPSKQGFDDYFGYLDQVHAHNYYPTNLWRNDEIVPLPENANDQKKTYSHDLFASEALRYIETNRANPFFLYLALTIPHANNELGKVGMEIPDDAPYSQEDWPQQERNKAAMITRMDRDIGKILTLLKELQLDENTLVIFTSDNGPHREGGSDPNFFQSAGPLRGIKRSLYEGGIRVPFIVRWPGKIQAASTNDYPVAFWDVLPTFAEIAGANAPEELDGASVLPTLLGAKQTEHPPLYWEFHEGGFSQAARIGKWKAVRNQQARFLEIYNLENDLGEQNNLAPSHAEIVHKFEKFLASARTESVEWPVKKQPVKSSVVQ
ncbi:MAG: arylsulfatase [Verrucomicrobiales bacterium]